MNAEIITPTLTIFDEQGKIDYAGNEKLLTSLMESGIDGVVPLGSTGEFTSLSLTEKKEFIDFNIKLAGNKMKVLPGTGCIDFNETVELSNYALEKGAQRVLIIGQYYYGMSQGEIFHYYDTLAGAISGPLYLYNFPDRTGTDFEPQTVLALLRKHGNIVGMKESVGGFGHTRAIMDCIASEFPDFEMYSGFDDQFLDNVDYGGRGSIGALSNLFPGVWADLVKAKNLDDYQGILAGKSKIHRLMPLYQMQSNVFALFKNILKVRGMEISTTCLFPFEKVDEDILNEALALVESVVDA